MAREAQTLSIVHFSKQPENMEKKEEEIYWTAEIKRREFFF